MINSVLFGSMSGIQGGVSKQKGATPSINTSNDDQVKSATYTGAVKF